MSDLERIAYENGLRTPNDTLLEPVRRAFRVAASGQVVEVLALTLLATDTL